MKKDTKKSVALFALAATGLLSLAACGPSDPASSDSANTESGGLPPLTSIDHTDDPTYLELTVENSDIPEGGTFFDTAKPTVTYVDNSTGKRTNATNWKFRTVYSIVDKNDPSKTYKAGDALPVGSYRATVENQEDFIEASVDFTVSSKEVAEAKEGAGYKTVKRESMTEYAVNKHVELGALKAGKFPSVGTPNILVVPVEFAKDKNGGNLAKFSESEDEVRRTLDEAFFGSTAHSEFNTVSKWESLSSYYYKSSYGKLDIGGVVTPVYTYTGASTAQFTRANLDDLVKNITTWCQNTLNLDMKDYDYDKDGYIDGIEIVYMTDQITPGASGTSGDSQDLWWNFTTTILNQNAPQQGNANSPAAQRYFWSRWDYVKNSYYASKNDGKPCPDAHTIVHETGHMMGLNDYYSYDRSDSGAQLGGPAGCVDMMDMNVGDHNAYSKMAYNWVDAKVVDGSSSNFSITLNSYTDTGDFLVLRNTSEDKWNETPWDEYLILEYYTPTGVNEEDSKGYPEWQQASSTGSNAYGHGGTYENPGLQVFHVDSRLASTQGTYDKVTGKKTSSKLAYTDNLYDKEVKNEDGTFEGAFVAPHSNTPSRSEDIDGGKTTNGAYREIHAIFSGGTNGLDGTSFYNSFGNTNNLFGKADYKYKGTGDDNLYGGSNYSNYKMRDFFPNDLTFDDKTTLNWTFSVTAQTDSSITLHFIENK